MGVSFVRRQGSQHSVDPRTGESFDAPFDEDKQWAYCDRCKDYLSALRVDVRTRTVMPDSEIDDRPIQEYYESLPGGPARVIFPRDVGDPFSGETILQYKIRGHDIAHARLDSSSRTRPRRGRPSRMDRRYRYILYSDGSAFFWPAGEPPDPKFVGRTPRGALAVEQGITDRPGDSRFIQDRRAHKLAKNREYVRRHRAKSRYPPFSEQNGTNRGRNGDQTVQKGVRSGDLPPDGGPPDADQTVRPCGRRRGSLDTGTRRTGDERMTSV